MITVREAHPEDGPDLIALFLTNPLRAGTSFVLDRGPDFFALLGLRGCHRTFVATAGGRIVGTASAVWHEALDGAATVRVGEIADLRVAEEARGGRAAVLLLGVVRDALVAGGAEWAVCLIGDRNAPAVRLVSGGAGLPALEPLERWASVHYVAHRLAVPGRRSGVREAGPDDSGILESLRAATPAARLAPPGFSEWPDPTGAHRGWIAEDRGGRPVAGLVTWDGNAVRRIRIAGYRLADLPLRAGVAVAARCGLACPLPGGGGVLTMWASRWLGARREAVAAVPDLVRAALALAARSRINVVQINVGERDPVLRALPRLPRSTYWSTLYGRRLTGGPLERTAADRFHADLARV